MVLCGQLPKLDKKGEIIMSYQDIEQRLNEITDKMTKILKNKGFVDQSGKAVRVSEFNALVKKAIKDCMEISKENELSGHIDTTASNVIEARIQSLREMLENQSLSVGMNIEPEYEQDMIEGQDVQEGKTAGLFKRATAALHRLFSGTRTIPVENEDVR